MVAPSLLCALFGLAADPCQVVAPEGGEWIELLPGKEFTAWRLPHGDWLMAASVTMDPKDPKRLAWTKGTRVAVNGSQGRSVDLVSGPQFGDVEAHIEFMVPKGSNSGVYFMGRYEVQVYDSFGVANDHYPGIECGGIYPRWINNQNVEGHSPRVNASRAPGEWQTFDVVFRAPQYDAGGKKVRNARFVRVTHNGTLIHENVEVTGPTRASLFNDEKPTGPLMLQGDHGPVAYRCVRVRPLAPESAIQGK